jgi:hypothetical protein
MLETRQVHKSLERFFDEISNAYSNAATGKSNRPLHTARIDFGATIVRSVGGYGTAGGSARKPQHLAGKRNDATDYRTDSLSVRKSHMMIRSKTTQPIRILLFPTILVSLTLLALGAASGANAGKHSPPPDLDVCQNLAAPAGNKVAFHTYASGVQIYRWNGASWVFQAPNASLYSDAGENGVVGTHYAGPTWESRSGSKVVGAVVDRCTPRPDAIQWLSLRAVSTNGPGIFHRVTFIQRVNTTGGMAPTEPGDVPGEIAEVPYKAEYYFYRGQND